MAALYFENECVKGAGAGVESERWYCSTKCLFCVDKIRKIPFW
jgi:hypothetical protein